MRREIKSMMAGIGIVAKVVGCTAVIAVPVKGWQANLAHGMGDDEAIVRAFDTGLKIVMRWKE